MTDFAALEEAFRSFSCDLLKWLPDGIIELDLQLLHQMGLLKKEQFLETPEEALHHLFHVIEADDKITLHNEQFAIWIVPEDKTVGSTLTLVALLRDGKPTLEIAFRATGVYNTPRYILEVLEHYLSDLLDTEAFMSWMKRRSS